MNRKIKLTIFCLTYNHKQFIKDAVESFLAQKTAFKTRILIFDDLSTDGTTEILREYQKKYPEQIKLVVAPYNTYNHPDREKILEEVYEKYLVGEYVAWCEGDDFWTDTYKLQKQVDFMDNNPDCMMTTHAFTVIDYSNEEKYRKKSFGNVNRYISNEEIILKPEGNLATASLVMRKEVFLRDKEFPRTDVLDFPLQLYAIVKGKVYYFKDNMCTYRFMHLGSWTKNTSDNNEKIFTHSIKFTKFLCEYNIYSHKAFKDFIWERIKEYMYYGIEALLEIKSEQRLNLIENMKNEYSKIGEEFLKVYKWMNSEYCVLNDNELNNLRNKKIAILGAGKYSEYIKRVLVKNGIKFDGCFITNTDSKQNNLLNIDKYIFENESFVVIVGISQSEEREINEYIYEKHIKNVMFPLWFNRNKILNE